MARKGIPQKRRRCDDSSMPVLTNDKMEDDDMEMPSGSDESCVGGQLAADRRDDWKEWTVEEVAQRLEEFGIHEDAIQKFRDNRIKGRNLDRITENHMKNDLMIEDLESRLRIQEFLDDKIHHTFKEKVFNDPVHGHMEIHPLCVAIIDTPEFQRLRYLKQLGACYFVYPGASHNRFEHSLGVCHLAGQLVRALQKRQPELDITDRDVLCVQIAGLCHDLGHGPFSHMFDNKFIPLTRPDRQNWKHEEASIQMFDHLVQKNRLENVFEEYGIGEAERIFVKEQIICKDLTRSDSGKMTKYYGPKSGKSFLYEIVANKRNGVDVDKWDYFKRDCLHLGIQSSFDHTRFIQFSRVISVEDELQICVRDKEAFNMYEMFHTRHALHRRAYQHRVVQAVEIMLAQAMKEADKYILTPGKDGKKYPISQCIDDMEAYTQLTDTVFQRILLSVDEPGLEKARAILHDIQCRKLYRCVGESEPITKDKIIMKEADNIRTEILGELSNRNEEVERLKLKDTSTFMVEIVKLDFGKNNENPVNNLLFFSKADRNKAMVVRASEVSYLVPQELYKEQLVRLFLHPKENKSDEQSDEQVKLLCDGFKSWCKSNGLEEPKTTRCIMLTPYKAGKAALERTPDHSKTMTKPDSLMKARQKLAL